MGQFSLADILSKSSYLVCLTGREMMVEDGIDSMRDMKTAYEIELKYGYSPEEVFSALMASGLAAGRVARRFLLSGAVEVTPDKQGRILIPQALRDHAGLVKEVSILGSDPYVEIWDTEAWRRECAKMSNDEIAQAMEKLGI